MIIPDIKNINGITNNFLSNFFNRATPSITPKSNTEKTIAKTGINNSESICLAIISETFKQ